MKNRNFIITILIVAVAVIMCLIYKKNIPDLGLAEAENYSDIENISFGFDLIFDDSFINSFTEYKDSYISEFKDSDLIFIGETTGKIHAEYYSMLQQVCVKKVIKGSITPGELIWIESESGLNQVYNKTVFTGVSNLMLPDSTYLVGLNESEVQITSCYENKPIYHAKMLGYLKLSDNSVTTVSMDKNYKLGDLENVEFFSGSKEVLDAINTIKDIILNYYSLN